MADLKVDDTGDLDLTDVAVVLTDGRESYQQRMHIKLRSFLGEYFLNTEYGIPWFQDILKKNPDYVTVQQLIKNAILSIPGVLELTKFDMSFSDSTRTLTVTLGAKTEEGEIDLSEEVDIS